MMRWKKLTFLATSIAWLWLTEQAPMAIVTQCVPGGAIVRNTGVNGWFCSDWNGLPQYICDTQQVSLCSAGCGDCGMVSGGGSNYCAAYHSPGPWPNDSIAQSLGCTNSNPWGVFYEVGCNCYIPSCQNNGTFCSIDDQCCSGLCSRETSQCGYASPILIDLGRSPRRLELTSAAEGVDFDIDGLGQRERVAWTSKGSPVAFLARDLNGNGAIDNGSELFGTATRLADGSVAPNGFVALADSDVNHDGRVDSDDPLYSALLVWIDSDHDGISEPGELVGVAQAGIRSISTTYRESRRRDRFGNRYAFVGTVAIVKDGRASEQVAFDVFFAVQR